ncbi:MAG: hypothetical protein AAGN46_04655 [Acidobacteriota bacterium]
MTRRDLLWIDGIGGLAVGLAMLLALPWLPQLFRLPPDLVRFIAIANLVYGVFSTTLARRARRPRAAVLFLIAANVLWGLACLRWAVLFFGTASFLGIAHMIAEGIYVGGLGLLEWRWRHELL